MMRGSVRALRACVCCMCMVSGWCGVYCARAGNAYARVQSVHADAVLMLCVVVCVVLEIGARANRDICAVYASTGVWKMRGGGRGGSGKGIQPNVHNTHHMHASWLHSD